jgi:Domain of unknown function (DUF1330)
VTGWRGAPCRPVDTTPDATAHRVVEYQYAGGAGGFGVDAARDWYRSPAYWKASRHRHLGADYAAAIVESAKRPAATSIPE